MSAEGRGKGPTALFEHSAPQDARGMRSWDRGTAALRGGVLAIIACVGTLSLPRPLGGDQALFVFTAREIHRGAHLYRDIWDAKQPGIYAFYTVAGTLFGFDEIGVHLLELVVLLVLAAVLQWTLPDLGFSRRAAAVAPVLVVLPYYLVSWTWDLGQLEPLLGLPLYVCMWAGLRSRAPGAHAWRWHVLAGVCAAIVTVFKLLYAPLPFALFLVALGRSGRTRAALAWAGGVLAVWIPVFAWVAARRMTHDVWYTWFEFPRTSRRQAAQPLSTLVDSGRSFGRSFAPVVALALVGLWQVRRRLERWMVLALTWIVVGLVLDLLQFWWRYLYWDLSVPIALFAVLGAQHLLDVLRRSRVRTAAHDRRVAAASLLVVVLLAAYALAPQRHRFQLSFPDPTATFRGDARQELEALEEEDYATIDETLAVLRAPDAIPGPIVVFGNPLVQLRSGRTQAGRIPGFLANTLGPREWRDFAEQMRRTPPAYVYIGEVQGTSEQEYLDRRGIEVAEILATAYCPLREVPAGRWLVRCGEVPRAGGGAR